MKTIVLAALASLAASACARPDPVLPYLAIGEYDGRCGYDWNEAGVELDMVPRLARDWDGKRDVLMVFHLEPVSAQCIEAAQAVIRSLGFQRTYVVTTDRPESGGPPLLPY